MVQTLAIDHERCLLALVVHGNRRLVALAGIGEEIDVVARDSFFYWHTIIDILVAIDFGLREVVAQDIVHGNLLPEVERNLHVLFGHGEHHIGTMHALRCDAIDIG